MNMEVTAKKSLAQPHNCYNIFFILERQKLIQARNDSSDRTAAKVLDENTTASSVDLAGYDSLSLPDLPQRYKGLTLENGWYVPGKNANRKHVKTHGLTSFAGLARTVASNWKVADSETKKYCNTVARIIKERHATLLEAGGIGSTKKKEPKKMSQKISMKKKQQMQYGWRRASDPPMPSNAMMANIPNRGNLDLSSSICGRPSASATYSGNIHPNLFSVTLEQQAFYNYLSIMNKNQENMHCSWSSSSAQYNSVCFETRKETQFLPGTSFKADANLNEHSRVNFEPNQASYNPESNPHKRSSNSDGSNKRMSCSDIAMFEDMAFDHMSAQSGLPLQVVSRPKPKQRRVTLDSAIAPSIAELLGHANSRRTGEGMVHPAKKINPSDPATSLMGEPDVACSTVPHRNMSEFHSNETIQEVDISDSDIRDMWWSGGV